MNRLFYHPALPALEERLAKDLELLGLPEAPWMPQRTVEGHPVLDVAIIGGGMAGLTAAAALKLIGITNTGVFDAAPAGAEGPWATHARMQTLRSPKELAGPALGFPSLTFRAWYTDLHGEQAWQALDRIPRLVWHAYLLWYRQALDLPVHNRHRLTHISQVDTPELGGVLARLEFSAAESGSENVVVHARHVVLATGMDGLGGPNVPEYMAAVDRRHWRHSSESIDFTPLRGRKIAIVGGGDSALDAAATALEAGATHVDIYMRGTRYTQINYWKAFTHAGHRYGYASLNAAERADTLSFLQSQRTPPARGTVQRLQHATNLAIHFGQSITQIRSEYQGLTLDTSTGTTGRADFLILATGYVTDLSLRPELRDLVPHMRFFEAGALDGRLPAKGGVIPRLAEDFSFEPSSTTSSPLLAHVHCFTGQALLSLGKLCGDIPGISVGARKLAEGIAAKLYRAEHAWHCQSLRGYDEQELTDEALQVLYAKSARRPDTGLTLSEDSATAHTNALQPA